MGDNSTNQVGREYCGSRKECVAALILEGSNRLLPGFVLQRVDSRPNRSASSPSAGAPSFVSSPPSTRERQTYLLGCD